MTNKQENTSFDKRVLIGMTVKEATSYCSKHGILARVAFIENGELIGLTADYVPDRINLDIDKNGLVFRTTNG